MNKKIRIFKMTKISSKNNIQFEKVSKFLVIFFIFIISFSKVSTASESIEKESTEAGDVAMASVWLVSEITQGGYIKPSTSLSVLDSNPHLLWELEGGWRFTNWFKLGFSLERTITAVDRINNPVTIIGFVIGTSGRNRLIGDFTLDLNFGSFETGNSDNSPLFIEPGFHIKQRLYKKIYWIAGISYRYVENESFAVLGHNSFNSLSIKLGLVNNKY